MISPEVGTWVGGKAVPCTVPAFDIVSLNSGNLKALGEQDVVNSRHNDV